MLLRKVVAGGKVDEINAATRRLLSPCVSLSWQGIATDDPYTTYRDHRIIVEILGDHDDRARAKQILEEAMLPAPRVEVIKALGRLRALTVSRSTDSAEGAMIFAAFADELAEWPGDAVISALAKWPRKSKFWPALAEILDDVRETAEERLAIDRKLNSLI